jgi:hypothetical protein
MTSRIAQNRLVISKIGASGESGLAAPRAYRIPEVCEMSGLGRTSIYSAINRFRPLFIDSASGMKGLEKSFWTVTPAGPRRNTA